MVTQPKAPRRPPANTPATQHQGAFERQALPHLHALRAAAHRYTARNQAESDDLVQETMLRALVAWHTFRPGTDCRAWLLRILTNTFINNYRRRTRERRLLRHDDLLVCPRRTRSANQPEVTIMEAMLAHEVAGALGELPGDFSRVVAMADVMGLRYREIADQLGCPIGTVMSRLHRGRRLLFSAVKANQDNPSPRRSAAA